MYKKENNNEMSRLIQHYEQRVSGNMQLMYGKYERPNKNVLGSRPSSVTSDAGAIKSDEIIGKFSKIF